MSNFWAASGITFDQSGNTGKDGSTGTSVSGTLCDDWEMMDDDLCFFVSGGLKPSLGHDVFFSFQMVEANPSSLANFATNLHSEDFPMITPHKLGIFWVRWVRWLWLNI